MVFVFGKKRVILVCAAVVLCAALAGAFYEAHRMQGVFLPSANKTIIIDAGHAA